MIKQLAKLAKLKVTAKEEAKLSKELKKILNYFKELEALDTEKVKPLTGGHFLKNVFREDEVDFTEKAESADEAGRVIEAFPEVDRGYLKVPKVL